MRILITGAKGQLGLALNEQLKDKKDIILKNTDVNSLDICNYEQVKDRITEFLPEVIVNCAAYTAVDLCETDQENAYQINAIGPKNLAMVAEQVGAKFFQISTDYVFDGNTNKPYVETDQTNPQSVYGTTKLEGEKETMKYCHKYFIIRTAWLYGEGKNFVKTMLHLAKTKDFLTVVDDQHGTPTSASELARMILYLMDTEQYGIYHGTCEGETTWYEFAKEIFNQAGITIKVNPVTTAEYKTVAKRPAYSVLENKKLKEETGFQMKNWKDALKEYMV